MPNERTSNYCPLDRRFRPWTEEEALAAEYEFYLGEKFDRREKWDELLTHKRVVVLAEAGSGKTAEFKQRAETLTGSTAFFVTVGRLAKAPFRDALETADEQTSFDSWLEDANEGVFFLDSVDEARMDGQKFRDALSHVAKALAGRENRATILVSCRVSDWRGELDLRSVEELLGQPKDDGASAQPSAGQGDSDPLLEPILRQARASEEQTPPTFAPHVVTLAPLNNEQAKRLAVWRGVEDANAFMADLSKAGAEALANRPQDLLALVDLWKSTGRIGSKHEALQRSIQQRLKEANPEHAYNDELSTERAIQGVKALAAALTLGKKRSIAFPSSTRCNSPEDITLDSPLDPHDALPDWTLKEMRTLLNRAVFDPASYGRVRFHHREVQELLCAEWLLGLMNKGCPERRIWRLLTEEKYGGTRLRPSMRPITSWLGQSHDGIRERVLQIAPEVLVEAGDPSQLTTSARMRLLDFFVELHRGKKFGDFSIDLDQVKRLAHADLAPKIRELWEASTDSDEVRRLALRMILAGEIRDCLDISVNAATRGQTDYEYEVGAAAIARFGSTEHRRDLANHLLNGAATYPSRALGTAVQAVYPSVLSLDELETLIRSCPPGRPADSHGLSRALTDIATSPGFNDILGLGRLLYSLARESSDPRTIRLSELLPPLVSLLARIVERNRNEPLAADLAEAVRFIGPLADNLNDYETDEAAKRLRFAIADKTAVNRQLFWLAVQSRRAAKGDVRYYWSAHTPGESWEITPCDFKWLIDDLKDAKDSDSRQVLYTALLRVWFSDGQKEGQLEALRDAIAGDASLKKELEQALNPTESDSERESRERREDYAEKRLQREGKLAQDWREFRDRLIADPGKLREVDHPSTIKHLCILARWLNARGSRDRYSNGDWQKLEAAYSLAVAEAARDGFVAYWRRYSPHVDDARRHFTPDYALTALVGIAIESVESSDFADHLSDEDIAHVTKLAVHEINSFPDWAPRLWTTKPSVVEPVIRAEIRWELRRKPANKNEAVYHVISKLGRTPEPFRSIAAEWVLSELELVQRVLERTLSSAIHSVTQATSDLSERLAALAESRFNSERGRSRRALWLATWLATDAEPAIDAWEEWLTKQNSRLKKTKIVITVLNALFDHGTYQFGETYSDFAQLSPLVRLIRLAYMNVRPNDDEQHVGVFTPGSRDSAERARNMLVNTLMDIPGEPTYRALFALAEDADDAAEKDNFKLLANRRATADADLKEWKPGDVVAFARTFEKPPATLEELHEVVLDRLWDIQDDLQTGHFSNKAALRQDDSKSIDETKVQLGIAHELHLRRQGAYSLEREPELESWKKPDINLRRPEIDEPVPVEVKVADSWSYNELRDAISDQLIAKYMKPRAATHGHLVVTYHGRQQTWRPGDGRPPVEFSALEGALQQEADLLCAVSPVIARISVTVVDLT